MVRKTLAAIALTTLGLASTGASAAVITFDGLGVDTSDPVVVDGFSFDYQFMNGWAIGNAGNLTNDVGNGTDFITCRDTGDFSCVIRMTRVGGGTFSISGLDAANVLNGTGSQSIEVLGLLNGGGTVSQTLTTADNVFTAYSLSSGFAGLVAVEFRNFGGRDDGLALDNLAIDTNVTRLPEPSTLLLLGMGLGSIGLMARRRARA